MFKKIFAACTAASLLASAPAAWSAPAGARDNMSHALAVTGMVETPLILKVADLRQMPPANGGEIAVTRHNGDKAETITSYQGVRLRDILDKAVLDAPGHNDVKKIAIIATATDGYAVVFSWGELYNAPAGEGVIVYYEKNGKALDDNDGEIALISAKDIRTGPRHVKWLNGIEVRKLVE
ncbi:MULTISPECIES: molybdopterin-dependent oxidoreductase [unclassified Janthinobacterium]|uniref:molybdopterin-dependent oxidoreductase n=1 Tax=unclassified Janthinobacterium TaxID=2610881 RepID=UPI000C710923|nr:MULTISPECIES: molybdopterin-dependent oxidoreductase [unclassified Janthinobacterium]PKV43325.1 molybdopterin-dependent oxidoreductase-like protein [Janthinobacterium sp. 61]TDY36364.1 molybdopterin-dependent oxidoreductase-like protein [Janthinobacterium sp. 75]